MKLRLPILCLFRVGKILDLQLSFHDVFALSYKEFPGIDTHIVTHEIKTYPGAHLVWHRIQPIHPWKVLAIKEEVEKLLKDGFIYCVPLTVWVSNLVPVTKKQGIILVYVDYRDLNKACPKDNYPIPFIDQTIDGCTGCEVFLFYGRHLWIQSNWNSLRRSTLNCLHLSLGHFFISQIAFWP